MACEEMNPGLGKNPGNSKKPMGMRKTGFYREKWEKREKLPFLNTCLKSMLNHWQITDEMFSRSK
jgi:hypothetical protein